MRWKWLGILAAAVMMLGLAVGVSAEVVSGNCGKDGDNLTWEYDTETCVLTISGEGEMMDYSSSADSRSPWYSYRKKIQKIDIADGIKTIGDFAFDHCSELTGITFPESIISIGDVAFSNCYNISRLIIPNNIISLGFSAFSNCYGISELIIQNGISSIGNYAFSYCSGITELSLPNSISSLGAGAFEECSGIIKVDFADNITYIGNSSFEGCSNINKLIFPESIYSIGNDAFNGCSNLTEVVFLGNAPTITSSTFANVSIEFTIYYNVATSGWTTPTWHGHPSIPTYGENTVASGVCGTNLIWILDGDETLMIFGEGAMTDWTRIDSVPWYAYRDIIKKVCINNSVTSIGQYAFFDCSVITELVLSDNLTTIGNSAFYGCSGITELMLPGNLTSIGNSAFLGCSGITELILPKNLISIGNESFRGCSGIIELILPDTLISIGNFSFYGCYELEVLVLSNSLVSIGEYAFSNCSSLTKLIFPDSLTSIGEYAFSNCSMITELTLPYSLTFIGNNAFCYCSKLSKVILPDNLVSLGNYTFADCHVLELVELPINLDSIGTYTFSGCKNLTEITFPASLTKIGGMAFGDCTGLTKATFHGDAPELGSTTFKNTSADLTLHYIDGKTGWTSPTWEQSGVTYNTATFIPATHHAVTLPDIFTGTESVISGADYTFSQSTDGQYYTYTNITATMSGEPVSVTDNGDGTYTIANVTGDLVISGTRAPKTELSLLLSDASGCTIHDGCLLGLPAGKTAGDVLALFANLSSGLSVHTADGTTLSASTHIGSGYTVRLTVDGTLYDTLTIVIRGDVNGDRFADELDLLFLQQYYAGHPVKPVHPLAGDINGDGMLTRADVMLLSRTIAGWYAVSAASDSAAAFCLFRPSDLPA